MADPVTAGGVWAEIQPYLETAKWLLTGLAGIGVWAVRDRIRVERWKAHVDAELELARARLDRVECRQEEQSLRHRDLDGALSDAVCQVAVLRNRADRRSEQSLRPIAPPPPPNPGLYHVRPRDPEPDE